MNPLIGMDWVQKTAAIDLLLERESLDTVPLLSGLEAELMKICASDICCVLKVWNRNSRPNVGYQFELLEVLYDHGLPVSRPYGWGRDRELNSVLLTSYDGAPAAANDERKLQAMADMLKEVHSVPPEVLDTFSVRRYDFIPYFFPRIEEHPDLHELLRSLVDRSGMIQDRLIHGDYHPKNIMEHGEKLTIIDWTNGQLGDPRYDVAWTIVLLRIYIGEHAADCFRKSFLGLYTESELEIFEAIAFLRVILLDRLFGLMKDVDGIQRARQILRMNPYLNRNRHLLG